MSDGAGNSGEQTPKRPVGRPWPKGVSGNPSGRPKGSIRLRQLLEPELEAVAQKLIEAAKAGDPTFVREFLDRAVGKPTVGEPGDDGQQVAEIVYRWADGGTDGA